MTQQDTFADADMTLSQVTDLRTRSMYEMYATGATLEEVGARFGITRERVRQVFREAGISTRSLQQTYALRREQLIEAKTDQIRSAFLISGDMAAISRSLKVPHSVVRDVVRAYWPLPVRRRRTPSKRKYETAEILALLQEANQAVEGRLAESAYRRYSSGRRMSDGRSWPSPHTILARFGSWRRAQQAAGIEVARPMPNRMKPKFSEEDCLVALRLAAEDLGSLPTATVYRAFAKASEGALPSEMTVRSRLGIWQDALTKAGLLPPIPTFSITSSFDSHSFGL
jgi:hypothetical protein